MGTPLPLPSPLIQLWSYPAGLDRARSLNAFVQLLVRFSRGRGGHCDSWRLYEGHCLKRLLRLWYTPSSPAGLITATAYVLHGVSAVHLLPLQNVVNSVARIILRKQRLDHITADIRDLLHWLPVQQRIEYKICVLVYKCLHQSARIYLCEFCIPLAATGAAKRSHLRSAVQGNLVVSYCRTKRYGQRS